MLTRATLLKRGLAAVAAIYGLKDLPVAEAQPVPLEVTSFRIMPLSSSGVVASGGLCAPSLYYELATTRPLHDALPVFSARRGGVSID